ncbi:MAG: GTPase HflX [Gemmatimonadetes bacterium]|nr:GTPase HflX [Gemmatimonadota bacterium]
MREQKEHSATRTKSYDETRSLFAPTVDPKARNESAVLVGVGLNRDTQESVERSLDELADLADTAGAIVVDRVMQRRSRIVGATYIGKGKLEELRELVEEKEIRLVIFDNDLSPAQGKNLETRLKTKVIDRSELILDIFATHAQTDTAKLQVELAQLEYAMPRLTKLWDHLSRLGGGIGTRGPGETQLEVDRRKVRDRIGRLKKELERFETSRMVQRKARRKHTTASLVGYTNAGKSTLLNAIAGSRVYVADELFATLDTTSRVVELDKDYDIIVSDTVGFIRKLPHKLIESFRATLSEVQESDFLIHVVDASNDDAEQQIETVKKVLEELGVQEKPVILVLNKADRAPDAFQQNYLLNKFGPGLVASAKTGQGLDELLGEMRTQAIMGSRVVDLCFPVKESGRVSTVHREGEVLAEKYGSEVILMRARLPHVWAERFAKLGFVADGDVDYGDAEDATDKANASPEE